MPTHLKGPRFLARVYPKVRPRRSGWFDWFCLTSLGEPAGESGLEKTKVAAIRAASREATRINAGLPELKERKGPDKYKSPAQWRGF